MSLLKVLLTNQCLYDCTCCINRRSSNMARAKFTVDEVVQLTIDFYKRNYIEGLSISSGIIRSHDDTMEEKRVYCSAFSPIPDSSARLLALGATAAASLAGHKGPLHAVRGRLIATREGPPLFVTVHPSFLLRLPDEDAKGREYARFVGELGEAKSLAERLAGEAAEAQS